VANTAQAAKRARQAEDARSNNASLRSRYRTAIKKVLKAVQAKDKTAAVDSYKQAVPVLDSMVNKKIIHQNKASRHKSRLNQQIKAIG
jgi:small subunit ribosomal protein S20